MVTLAVDREKKTIPSGIFNNAQLEVLKIFNHDFTDEQLKKLRILLVKFLNEIVQEEFTRKLSVGEISLQTIQNPDLHCRSKVKAV